MLKAVIYDMDGVVIHPEMTFSERFSREFNVPLSLILPFFRNEFKKCLIGKADLKEEIKKYLPSWGWERSIGELFEFWFSNESLIDDKILEDVKDLRAKGILCYLATVNEKYRVEYISNRLGLGEKFDAIFSSAEIGYKKPAVEFWEKICERINIQDKNEVFVWDDEEEALQAARSFGFQAEFYMDFDSYRKKMGSLFRV